MKKIGFVLVLIVIHSSNLYSQRRFNLEEMREKLDSIETESNFLISIHNIKETASNLFDKGAINETMTLAYELKDTIKVIFFGDKNRVYSECSKYGDDVKQVEVKRNLTDLEDSLINIKLDALKRFNQDTSINFHSSSSILRIILRQMRSEVLVFAYEQSTDSLQIVFGNSIVYNYKLNDKPYLIRNLTGEQRLISIDDDITVLFIVLKDSQIINSLDLLKVYFKLKEREKFEYLQILSRVNNRTYQYNLKDKKFKL